MRDEIIACLSRREMERGRGMPAPAPHGDHELNPSLGPRKVPVAASVLVPLIDHRGGMTVLFTQRTDHLYDHAGQISFPGGRVEPGDRDPVETALRETEEEIGLARARIEPLGTLDPYLTGTGYSVTPVVGLIEPPLNLRLDPFEVAEAFEVPLAFLLDPANRGRVRRTYGEAEREYYAFRYRMRYIWGATAGILVNFCELLERA